MKRMVATLFVGLALMALLAPGAQAMPWADPNPGENCICLPQPDVT
jgi:hypothetical protein